MPDSPTAAIVDYALGNLYSVRQAAVHAGFDARITNDATAVLDADLVILPGVGAFGDAMAQLEKLDLVKPLREVAARGTPFFGVCLGQQLLMSRSEEFGDHRGLDILPGKVIRFREPKDGDRALKVPQVGWNAVHEAAPGAWKGTPLAALRDESYMYFVHSYFTVPDHASDVLAWTQYGDQKFASALRRGNVFSCQFHPERSGTHGLEVYRQLFSITKSLTQTP